MQVPEITNYTMVNRTYRYFEGVPLFPFGYGLYDTLIILNNDIDSYYLNYFCRSYTTFKYSDLKIVPTSIKSGQNVIVSVTVTNTGNRTSDEVYNMLMEYTTNAPIDKLIIQVVQVYISWTNTDTAPIRQLVGAKRIPLISPSKSVDVSIKISTFIACFDCPNMDIMDHIHSGILYNHV